jgi:hypothetical protein
MTRYEIIDWCCNNAAAGVDIRPLPSAHRPGISIDDGQLVVKLRFTKKAGAQTLEKIQKDFAQFFRAGGAS